MDIEKRKLTPYEKASLWGEIDHCGFMLQQINKNTQDSAEFYKIMDLLHDLQRKLKWHEVAVTVEKGENS